MADSIADTAGFLAVCSAALDRHARSGYTSDDELFEKMLRFDIEGFFEAFEDSIKRVVPALELVKRAEPVRHAGCSGTSYHAVVCSIALKQYKTIWSIYNPMSYIDLLKSPRESHFDGITGDEFYVDDVVRLWPRIAEHLSGLFADVEPIDSEFLIAGIATDPLPNSASAISSPTDRRMPSVTFDDKGTATILFEGAIFSGVDFEAATILQELIDHYPSPHGLTTDDRPQPGRIIAKLPEKIQAIIKTDGKKGRVLAV